MKPTSLITASLLLALAAAWPARSQESPTSLTRAEFKCQKALGGSLAALGTATAACLAECRSSPGRRCFEFSPDAITADCLDRARTAAELPLLRSCAGSDCPECYDGGDCSDYTGSAFSDAVSIADATTSALYCDDSFSADGLTRDEQRCQRGLLRADARFVQGVERCFSHCQEAVNRGATGFSSCSSAFVDAPSFDPRTQRCIDRARGRLRDSCAGHCQDPPDCFGSSCDQAAAALEAQTFGLEPTAYCQEPGVCGDGQVTGAEVCDFSAIPSGCGVGESCNFGCRGCSPVCGDGILVPSEPCDASASPSGCADGFACQSCSFCVEKCGDGVVESGETCDRNAVETCPIGTACDASCSSCQGTESVTEDFPPCDFFFPTDTWNFDVAAGQNVVILADNVASQSSAGLEMFVNCTNGLFSSSFGDFPCSVPGPFFFCPAITFLTPSDARCSVTVEPFFCPSTTAGYRLDVSGTGLDLVTDDGQPASPSGAFIDTPADRRG
jgi:hypothetical protein